MLTSAYYAYGSLWAALNARYPIGQNVYDAEWDVCIVLDSARFDAVRCVAGDESPWDGLESAWSVGSITTEWLTNTFRPAHGDAIAATTLLSANPHTTTVFDERAWLTNPDEVRWPYPANPAVDRGAFDAVHDLFATHAGDHGAVPPSVMRDATIAAHRETDGRVLAFWLQPHEPFIAPAAPLVGGAATETNVWAAAAAGEIEPSEVVASYVANLRLALEHVECVLSAVDARVLVTADHGNFLGEWGLWGHPFGMPHPAVRRVPWLACTAEATSGYEPEIELERDSTGVAREEQLRALGYL